MRYFLCSLMFALVVSDLLSIASFSFINKHGVLLYTDRYPHIGTLS